MVSTPSFLRIRLFDNNASYNLNTKTFDIRFQTGFSPIPGYMSFRELAVKCNLPVKEYLYRYFPKGSVSDQANPLYNTIKLPMPEKIAIQIEESIQQFEFVLEFKMTSYKIFSKGSVNNYFVPLGNVVNMYIIDKKSHEIYYAVDKNRLKVLKVQQEKIRQEKLQREEQERAEQIKEQEREQQEQIKKERECKKIFSSINEVAIESKVTDYLNTKYAKQIKECERKLEKLVLNYAGDVNILLCGDSMGVNIVKVDEDIVNDELNNLQPSSTLFYTLNGENYYKCQDKIFFTKKIHVETKTFEHGYSGLKNRGGTFQYYGNILDMVKKACEQNFTKRGEYFFEYSIIGDEVIVKELILERKQRDEIRGKETTGRKILTTGGAIVLLGVIAACSAL